MDGTCRAFCALLTLFPGRGSFPAFVCMVPVLRAIRERDRSAPVAQLDRASDYGSEGREFESSLAHHTKREAGATLPRPFWFRHSIGYRGSSLPYPPLAPPPYPSLVRRMSIVGFGPRLLYLVQDSDFTKSTRETEPFARKIFCRMLPYETIVFAGNNACMEDFAEVPRFLVFCFLSGKGYNQGHINESIYMCANEDFDL